MLGGIRMDLSLETLRNDYEVKTYLERSTEYLGRLGYTEHGTRHAGLVAARARNILEELHYDARQCELAAMAGYLHDVANMINRFNHGGSGALMAYVILSRLGLDPSEMALIVSAIGNHEEERGQVVNHVAAALILADKSDVHRTRVTCQDFAKFDIHDRVNYAVEKSSLTLEANSRIELNIRINTDICPIMEYFEIFLERMIMCRRAAEYLDCQFGLIINENQLL